jgi:hypothetical protein
LPCLYNYRSNSHILLLLQQVQPQASRNVFVIILAFFVLFLLINTQTQSKISKKTLFLYEDSHSGYARNTKPIRWF